MKKLLVLVITLFLAINLNAQVEPPDSDGNGYRNVSTLDHLRWIEENESAWNLNYELHSDINAAETKEWNNGLGWKPIGNETVFFSGQFDGRGYKIDSLYINRPTENFVGFFGIVLEKSVSIRNFGLTRCSITGNNYVGSLAGRNSYCSINDCSSSGSVTGAQYTGGLIGKTSFAEVNHSFSICSVSGSTMTGGLIGYAVENTVNYCYSEGTVSGTEIIGGIIGTNEKSNLNNSYSSAKVSGTNKIGGLVGYNNQSRIDASSSSGLVTGNDYIGGLVGNNDNSNLLNSFFTGQIDGKHSVGGIAGWNDGGIDHCYTKSAGIKGIEFIGGLVGENDGASLLYSYSESSVSGSESIGGLVGRNGFGVLFGCYSKDSVSGKSQNTGGTVGWNDGGSVLNCYSSSIVSGSSDVGGLVGDNDGGKIHNCYSTSKVTGTGQNVGGFVGWNGSGKVINSYWDKEFSAIDKSTAGIGKTTNEMKTMSTFSDFGWNFAAIWKIDKDLNNGYPFIDKRTYIKAPGKQPIDNDGDGYLNIKCFSHLVWISETVTSWVSDFELDKDINADSSYYWDTNNGFSPIGTKSNQFVGQFKGNGHTIDSLYIYRTTQEYVGMFGYVYSSPTAIRDLGLTGCSITGGNYTGAVLGWNVNANIYNCYVTGSVSSFGVGGGVVGDNYAGSISNCYSRASVSGTSDIGGLVGWNDDLYASILNCYSTGVVTGDKYTGGLVGWNKSSITNCFWDMETSGWITSDGGTGKTSTEMKTKSTFTNALWDFENIWDIDNQTNDGYPFIGKEASAIIDLKDIAGDMLISPNPAFNVINLTLTGNNSEIYTAFIYNDYGQIVLGESSNSSTIDQNNLSLNIESLPTGAYTLILQSNSKRLMKKFLVVR